MVQHDYAAWCAAGANVTTVIESTAPTDAIVDIVVKVLPLCPSYTM